MAQLQFSALGYNPEPQIDIWINGYLWHNARVLHITDSAGLEPASCTILFPSIPYDAHPVSEGDKVIIYINRVYNPEPKFRGNITGFGDSLTVQSGGFVEAFCLDDIAWLNTAVCTRNYNIKDSRDNFSETLTLRQIAADISTQAKTALGGNAPNINTYAFPNTMPGEFQALGIPYNEALLKLLDLADDGKYFMRRSYSNLSTYVTPFKVGTGEIADLTRGVDIGFSARNQYVGVVNAGEIRKESNLSDMVNAGTLIGDRLTIETSLALSKGWKASKEVYLTNLEAYTRKGTDDNPNPDYDPEAERVGRAYRFSTVNTSNTGTFIEYPEILPRLLASSPFPSTVADFAKPYVVYQFSGEATYNVTFQINIKDNEVIIDKPLIKDSILGTGVANPILPVNVWLECAYKLRSPLVIEGSRQGPISSRTNRRIFTRTDFQYKYLQSPYFLLSQVPTTASYTSALTSLVPDVITASRVTTGSVNKINDSPTASRWLTAKIKSTQDRKTRTTYELPRMDLNYRVGQNVRENWMDTKTNIFSIEYDLEQFKTLITAMSR